LEEAAALIAQAQAKKAQPAFRVGGRVNHPKYGFGIVLGVEGQGEEVKVTVSFNRFGRKKLLARLAKLERI
jgi:DNA helicase-2/ATP-dependent DNA helicase PcrA